MSDVRVGQLWADNDKRCAARRLLITAVDDTHATAYGFYEDSPNPGRDVRIRLDRFKPTSTGYRLLKEYVGPSASPAPDSEGGA